jgi:CO/xanthine dehydrogenase Mo-binding subunit
MIGQKMNRIDAFDKATGKVQYAGDLSFPRMLYGKAFFSEKPHARILSIDLSEAQRLEGVVRIFTSSDIEGSNGFGATKPHQPILVPVGGVARFLGDALALVVAENEKVAEKASKLVRVEYEELPGVFSIDEAIRPDAPQIHADAPGNNCATQELAIGDVGKGFEQSDVTIEEWVSTSRQEHAYLETEAAVGTIDNQGQVVLYSCIQDPHYFASDIAQAVGLPMSQLRVVGTSIGGGFGGKDDITLQVFVALAVKKLRRPVKMVYTREESFISSVKRHPMKIRVKLGATKDGKIRALEGEILADAGPYSGRSPVVMTVASHSFSGPYCIPNLKVVAKAFYTNNPVGGACRGYGQPQSSFAREVVIERLAQGLQIDPLELRRKNFLKQGDPVGTRLVNLDAPVSMPKVFDSALELAGPPRTSTDPNRVSGRGIACTMPLFDIAALPSLGLLGAGVAVQLMADGTLKVYSTAVEMGQGITTVLTQIAAEEFGLTGERISIVLGDTDLAQKSGPTTASRQTYVSGNALLMALGKLKERLAEKAGQLLGEAPEKILFQDGEVVSPGGGKGISLRELAKKCYYEGVNLREESWFKATHAMIGHTFMATVADVEVDLKTGTVSIIQLINAHDTGYAINPDGVRGQLIGGSVQSLGWALSEDFVTERGYSPVASLAEYLIPTAMDLPDVKASILEDPYPTGPYGAKGVGEHATVSTTPAIVNAINHATGCFFGELPVTSEKIFWEIRRKRGERHVEENGR